MGVVVREARTCEGCCSAPSKAVFSILLTANRPHCFVSSSSDVCWLAVSFPFVSSDEWLCRSERSVLSSFSPQMSLSHVPVPVHVQLNFDLKTKV